MITLRAVTCERGRDYYFLQKRKPLMKKAGSELESV